MDGIMPFILYLSFAPRKNGYSQNRISRIFKMIFILNKRLKIAAILAALISAKDYAAKMF